MLFELRQYTCTPGNREAFIQVMEEDVIPFQVSKGMVILASFAGEEDESAYVWIRRFKDEAARVQLYDAVYKSDHWNTVIAPKIAHMLVRDQIKVTRLTPTPKSPLQ
ncbi:MAG: NIPSNAP family protein [Dehalococcoidia bacterium]